MSRKARLLGNLSSSKLKEKYKKSQDPVEGRRWHLLWKVSLGWSIKNSALAIGINYDYARKIVSRYNHQGEAAVKNKRKKITNHQRGKKTLLNEQQLELLTQKLEKDQKMEEFGLV